MPEDGPGNSVMAIGTKHQTILGQQKAKPSTHTAVMYGPATAGHVLNIGGGELLSADSQGNERLVHQVPSKDTSHANYAAAIP